MLEQVKKQLASLDGAADEGRVDLVKLNKVLTAAHRLVSPPAFSEPAPVAVEAVEDVVEDLPVETPQPKRTRRKKA